MVRIDLGRGAYGAARGGYQDDVVVPTGSWSSSTER